MQGISCGTAYISPTFIEHTINTKVVCVDIRIFFGKVQHIITLFGRREREGDYEKMFGKGNRLLKKEQSHIAQLTFCKYSGA